MDRPKKTLNGFSINCACVPIKCGLSDMKEKHLMTHKKITFKVLLNILCLIPSAKITRAKS